jgi:hypothetical protein
MQVKRKGGPFWQADFNKSIINSVPTWKGDYPAKHKLFSAWQFVINLFTKAVGDATNCWVKSP